MWQFLFKRHCSHEVDTGLTIGEVNRQLNRLALSEVEGGKRDAVDEAVDRVKAGALRVQILHELLRVATPPQMSWIVKIILRELKVHEATSPPCACSALYPCIASMLHARMQKGHQKLLRVSE